MKVIQLPLTASGYALTDHAVFATARTEDGNDAGDMNVKPGPAITHPANWIISRIALRFDTTGYASATAVELQVKTISGLDPTNLYLSVCNWSNAPPHDTNYEEGKNRGLASGYDNTGLGYFSLDFGDWYKYEIPLVSFTVEATYDLGIVMKNDKDGTAAIQEGALATGADAPRLEITYPGGGRMTRGMGL